MFWWVCGFGGLGVGRSGQAGFALRIEKADQAEFDIVLDIEVACG